MKKAIFAIGILSSINAAVLLSLSNMHSGNLFQAAISVAIILYAIIYDKISRKTHVIIVSICLVPVALAIFLAVYAHSGNVDYTEDVVIVPGAGLQRGEAGLHLARRLDAAIVYLNRNTDAVIIVCGGLGARQTITEAEAMKRYLTARGVLPERIILEEKSTSTYENLVFAKEILDRRFPDGFRAVLITNDFHIYRFTSLARRIGISANHVAASTPWFTLVANYLREMAAVTRMCFFLIF